MYHEMLEQGFLKPEHKGENQEAQTHMAGLENVLDTNTQRKSYVALRLC